VRTNAAKLGVDPNRIAAAGGSAGGHLAASTAFIREFDDASEKKEVSAVPNALVLFNPALMLAPLAGHRFESSSSMPNASLLGAEASRISPVHHVKSGGPPTIIFHGRADKTVPYATAEVFAKVMKAVGNPCTLIGYPDQGHAFFNSEPWVTKTLIRADEFLGSLGWLKGKPTLTPPQ
jgi:acetyl esterase